MSGREFQRLQSALSKRLPPVRGADRAGFEADCVEFFGRCASLDDVSIVPRHSRAESAAVFNATLAPGTCELQRIPGQLLSAWAACTHSGFAATSIGIYREALVFRFITVSETAPYYAEGALLVASPEYQRQYRSFLGSNYRRADSPAPKLLRDWLGLPEAGPVRNRRDHILAVSQNWEKAGHGHCPTPSHPLDARDPDLGSILYHYQTQTLVLQFCENGLAVGPPEATASVRYGDIQEHRAARLPVLTRKEKNRTDPVDYSLRTSDATLNLVLPFPAYTLLEAVLRQLP